MQQPGPSFLAPHVESVVAVSMADAVACATAGVAVFAVATTQGAAVVAVKPPSARGRIGRWRLALWLQPTLAAWRFALRRGAHAPTAVERGAAWAAYGASAGTFVGMTAAGVAALCALRGPAPASAELLIALVVVAALRLGGGVAGRRRRAGHRDEHRALARWGADNAGAAADVAARTCCGAQAMRSATVVALLGGAVAVGLRASAGAIVAVDVALLLVSLVVVASPSRRHAVTPQAANGHLRCALSAATSEGASEAAPTLADLAFQRLQRARAIAQATRPG